MTITLYKNSSEEIKLDKVITQITSLTGTLRDQTSILNPTIIIEGSLSSVTGCNYMYIPEFGRYYFVTDIVSIREGLYQISGKVDVLMTYRSQIRSNKAIIKRNENKWNLYVDDGIFKTYQNPMILSKAFPSGFNKQEFVLAVAGS